MSVVNNNLLLTADAGVAPSAYQIQRSLRFNSADSAYLNRTPSVAGNQKTWTWSGWVKRCVTSNQMLFNAGVSGTQFTGIQFYGSSTNQIEVFDYSSAYNFQVTTTPVYRDTSAWMHVLVAFDATNATTANRVRIYVNGSEVTTFATASYPANTDWQINSTVAHNFGRSVFNGTELANMYLADIHFIDGQALTPSSFTETNATTGQLVPKAFSGTYGTNGFRLNFSDNSAATAATLGADSRTDGALNGNNGTLVNGPTYSSANGGSIVFDGVDDYVIATRPSSIVAGGQITISLWAKWITTGTTTSTIQALLDNNHSGSPVQGFVIQDRPDLGKSLTFSPIPNVNGATSTFIVGDGSWHHITGTCDGSTVKLYIDGSLNAQVSQSGGLATVQPNITLGKWQGGGRQLNGNIAQASIYNRALSASEITQNYNALVGRFGGTSTGSIVTDGMVLNLDAGNTASYPGTGTTWTDISLRKNNWTPNNLSVTAGAGCDSLTDTPTSYGTDTGAGGEVRGNYCTWNPLEQSVGLSNGNLEALWNTTSYKSWAGTIFIPQSGKWYYECTPTTSISGNDCFIGIAQSNGVGGGPPLNSGSSVLYRGPDGQKYVDNAYSAYGSTYTVSDVIGVAINVDAGQVTFYKNNVSQGVISYSFAGKTLVPFHTVYNASISTNFGQRPFAYAAPSGFKALCDTNIPEGSITTSGTFTGNANANGPFVWLNGVPTAMTINSNAVTFATHVDKLANGFKVRSSSGTYNTAGTNTYSITTTGAKFKYARAQANP